MDCCGSLHSQPRLLGKFPAGQSVSANKMDCPLGQPCDRYKQDTHIPYAGKLPDLILSVLVTERG